MENILKENERLDDLQFKGLKIIQNKDEFCFGIDSILLSDFAKDIRAGSKVIDFGTGTGIISLLLCKKTKLDKIYGIEIQKHMCDIAERNRILNKLEDKLEIINENIRDLASKLPKGNFDAIITNPPYKKINSGIKNERESKYISRHEAECSLEDIIEMASKLLKSNGSLYMVHRPERLTDIFYYLRKYRIEPKTLKFVQPSKEREPNLVLVKATKNAGEFLKIEKNLIVYDANGNYTNEILEIYNKTNK